MDNYVVPAETEAIVVGAEAEWNGSNLRPISTKQENRFAAQEVIINPMTGECSYAVNNAGKFAESYALCGYFGFKRGEHCIIVHSKDVFVQQ